MKESWESSTTSNTWRDLHQLFASRLFGLSQRALEEGGSQKREWEKGRNSLPLYNISMYKEGGRKREPVLLGDLGEAGMNRSTQRSKMSTELSHSSSSSKEFVCEQLPAGFDLRSGFERWTKTSAKITGNQNSLFLLLLASSASKTHLHIITPNPASWWTSKNAPSSSNLRRHSLISIRSANRLLKDLSTLFWTTRRINSKPQERYASFSSKELARKGVLALTNIPKEKEL